MRASESGEDRDDRGWMSRDLDADPGDLALIDALIDGAPAADDRPRTVDGVDENDVDVRGDAVEPEGDPAGAPGLVDRGREGPEDRRGVRDRSANLFAGDRPRVEVDRNLGCVVEEL